jgi:hypothetical protein
VVGTPEERDPDISNTYLKGTTYRVYRYLVKQSRPASNSKIQKALGLSSPSVSLYHIKKLIALDLVREEQEGYVINKMVLENVIRIRQVSIPVQTMYVAFFAATLVVLTSVLRPTMFDSLYFFAVMINLAALSICLYEAARTLRRL